MDVGLVVSFSGLIAAAFALLASVALAVELGVAPGKNSGRKNNAKDEKSVQQTSNSKRSRGKPKETTEQNSTDNSNNNSLQQTNFDTVRATESGGMEALAAQLNSSAESIINLQQTYVDGLLGPRKKYDVALAILNEFQSTDVSEEDKGLLMATQAYLSATRTGSLSSGSLLLGGGGDKSISKKQTTEIAKPDDTTDATTVPDKKTVERRRPSSRSNLSKKPTTGDDPKPGTARNTKRNTRS